MIGKMARRTLYEYPSDMEPLLPEDRDGSLAALALQTIRGSERLRGKLHPATRRGVAELVQSMNSYYSNLIEGHRTRPMDIDRALRQEFGGNREQRNLQQLHWAHVETERWMKVALGTMSTAEVCSGDFLCAIHREFYSRLPDEFKNIASETGRLERIESGALRMSVVSVGIHVPPAPASLPRFLKRFSSFYAPLVEESQRGLIAAAAAHHRLAWIHPFLDGNGRVTRLFTLAWFSKIGLAGDGLWTLSRGFARQQSEYKAMLAQADERRLNDFDGRGYLSDRRLGNFCEFVLKTALDQIAFMEDLLELEALQRRVLAFGKRLETEGALLKGSGELLRDILLRGEIPRGDVARIVGVSPRTGQTISGALLRANLLQSDSPKGSLRLGFPALASASYFPNLFPAGAD